MVDLKTVVVLSGGLDSTTSLYWALSEGIKVIKAVGFNYGQRHKKELEYAKETCAKLDIPFTIIDLWSSGFTEGLSNSKSSLVTDTEVPEGHYAAETMAATIVPNRNMVMISIASAIAVAEGADSVTVGVHAGDHFIYPDCRPEFISATTVALRYANPGFDGVVAPFVDWSKADIAILAGELAVPYEDTWSCYKGDDIHCGCCGTCVERLEAIYQAKLVGYADNTEYEDDWFWTTVTKENCNG